MIRNNSGRCPAGARWGTRSGHTRRPCGGASSTRGGAAQKCLSTNRADERVTSQHKERRHLEVVTETWHLDLPEGSQLLVEVEGRQPSPCNHSIHSRRRRGTRRNRLRGRSSKTLGFYESGDTLRVPRSHVSVAQPQGEGAWTHGKWSTKRVRQWTCAKLSTSPFCRHVDSHQANGLYPTMPLCRCWCNIPDNWGDMDVGAGLFLNTSACGAWVRRCL